MANLNQKNGIYNVRFRYQGKEYKKSLKTRDEADAKAAVKGIEQTIHLLAIGQKQVPDGVDPGDFIAGGGKECVPRTKTRVDQIPPMQKAIEDYLASLHGRLAETYIDLSFPIMPSVILRRHGIRNPSR